MDRQGGGWRISYAGDLRLFSRVNVGVLLGLLRMTTMTTDGGQVLDLNHRFGELCEATGVSRHSVYYCLQQLMEAGAVRRDDGHRGVYYVEPDFFVLADGGAET